MYFRELLNLVLVGVLFYQCGKKNVEKVELENRRKMYFEEKQ